MKKRLCVFILTLSFILGATANAYAFAGNVDIASGPSKLNLGGVSLYSQYIAGIDTHLTLSGSNANVYVSVFPMTSTSISYIKLTAYLKKSNGTTIKTFTDTLYYSFGKFMFEDNYTLTTRGGYYVHAAMKCYKLGQLVETVTTDSTTKVY